MKSIPYAFKISLHPLIFLSGLRKSFRHRGWISQYLSRFGGPGAQIHLFRMFIMIWQRAIRIGQIHFRPLLNKNQVSSFPKVKYFGSLDSWPSGIVPKCLSLSPTKKVFSRVFSIIVSTHRLLSLAGYVGMSGQESWLFVPQPSQLLGGRKWAI